MSEPHRQKQSLHNIVEHGTVSARDQIVAAHAGLAFSIARPSKGRGEERDDLRQVALIALVRAVERFRSATRLGVRDVCRAP